VDYSETNKEILNFRNARDWKQFHNARTLAASLTIESSELLEIFQWTKDEDLETTVKNNLEKIKEELADVYIYLAIMVHDLDIDLGEAVIEKLKKNTEKYPLAKAKGSSKKYTEFEE
jgi:NTP pyrophosphatase (non-canonical NTP hydrolase)